MLGIESGKTIITLSLYSILFIRGIQVNFRSDLNKNHYFPFLFSLFAFSVFLLAKIMYSDAMGYEYYFDKSALLIINIVIPTFLYILFGTRIQQININLLLRALEVLSVLFAILLLLNAYTIGVNEILTSKHMVRVGVGQSNVIWTGRFISIGFIIILLAQKNILYKTSTLLLILIALILTGSKSTLLIPFISIIIYFFLPPRGRRSTKRKKYSIYLGIFVLVISAVFNALDEDAVESRFSTNSRTIGLRTDGINKVIEDAFNRGNYISGNGFATSGYPILGNYDDKYYPHNVTVELFYELGIIGIFLFYIILLFPFWLQKKLKRPESEIKIVLAINLMFIFYAQTSGDLTGNSFVFIISSYLVFSLPFLEKIAQLRPYNF